eukprot:gnl/Chilomastix_caulleri/761.p1 GENE.gnl/Chilomastix_caulleri/761~~gnl/Chilomastix_caulleri/761.p1  ORF type:complete len:322 (+),score=81.20 gnl/Chilomastix_caulleri/761:35-1000(+)
MSIEVDTSSIEAFVAGFAAMQKSSLEFLMGSTEKLKDLREAIEGCADKTSGDSLQVLQYVSALALHGLEECFEEYNAYKDKWLPAISQVRGAVDIPNASDTAKQSAITLIKLIQGMQVIINSIMSISDQYKFLAEEANVRFEATAGAIAGMGNKETDKESTDEGSQSENSEGEIETKENQHSCQTTNCKVPETSQSKQRGTIECNHVPSRQCEGIRVGSTSPGPRPEERAQLRRGVADQDIGVAELSEELERPPTSHEEERLKGDLRISCARLATAKEEQHFISYSVRNEQRAAQLRGDIRAARAHGDDLDGQMSKLLSVD